ncbi:hydroxyproline-rich glycoprotein family protein [Tasmannia lanceolata]|uniref:hydroxyproline-rich glycoprotein family protein n=1 Tax=Tasmannia lanceolata TaxID=3420 RepID=UPI0040642F01
MRGLGRLANGPNKQTLISSSAFSTFSGGSGRGRGSGPPKPPTFSRPPGQPEPEDPDPESDTFLPSSSRGHGRGKPIPSTPIFPSFPSWMSPPNNPSAGRGRIGKPDSPPQEPTTPQPKKPIFFSREDNEETPQNTKFSGSGQNPDEGFLPPSGIPGAGRGKPGKLPVQDVRVRVSEENRHIRQQPARGGFRRGAPTGMQPRAGAGAGAGTGTGPSPLRLSREDAVKKAVGILSRGGEEGGRGRGGRGRGGRGRGMQARRGRGGRGRGGRFEEDDYGSGLYLGDKADGERLEKRIGEEGMNNLVEGFEEMSSRVLPSPMDEAYLDALDTNYLIEFEPEYLMEEFGTNPDIDDKPPIPLRDALEKMKPFLMAYEGIGSQEEWEDIMKETMEKVPYLKEIVDMYSGPDRVTAKQQQQELERVAKTLPENVPSSVKRFTDRAVLSLQSNPGWGWDKKCQFMDKLVWEVSQRYK